MANQRTVIGNPTAQHSDSFSSMSGDSGAKLVYSAVITSTDERPLTDLLLAESEHEQADWAESGLSRTGIITYTVQSGDTLWSVAAKFQIDVDTLRFSNPELERNPDMLAIGTELIILPIKGAYHSVQEGETLDDIARSYGVAVEDVVNYPGNEIAEGEKLKVGQNLIIPYGGKWVELPIPPLSPESRFAFPTLGKQSQGYHSNHRAIDISAPYGAGVYAADSGTVIHAAWSKTGYGYTIIINHGKGWQTLYSHLKGTWVHVGDVVERGQLIGEVGSTGNSTGPHIHFEVRRNGERLNPLEYLPAGGL